MRLTDASIRALKRTERQVLYRDSTLPGFGVRVSPKGVKSFCLMHGADRRLTTIGRYPIISLAEARGAARRILAQKTLGTYQPRSIRFSEALDLFVQTHCAGIKSGYEYERMLKREVLPSLKSKTLDKITSHDITDILDKRQVDNFYAIHNRISLRLGARIWDLRNAGWQIETEERADKNTVYRLTSKPKKEQLRIKSV